MHVVLSAAERDTFKRLLEQGDAGIDQVMQSVLSVDARRAQVSKAEDRDYILGEVAKLGGGLSEINATVCGALRGWLAREGRAALERLPAAERGTSVLIHSVALLLQNQGDLAGAAPLYREALDARRETLGAKHPDTLISIFNFAMLLGDQGEESEAKRLCQEAVDGAKEVLGVEHPHTRAFMENLSQMRA